MKILALRFNENIPAFMKPYTVINATSGSGDQWKALSPFHLGPVHGMNGRARNVENYWQFSKVYELHYDSELQLPTPEYYDWRAQGFNSHYAHRYPMGKGKIPVGSWIDGIGMVNYVTARKMIYIPVYTDALKASNIYQDLLKLVKSDWERGRNLVIWDYDVFDHEKKGLTLKQVVEDPRYKYGHGFVLEDLLTNYVKTQLES